MKAKFTGVDVVAFLITVALLGVAILIRQSIFAEVSYWNFTL